MAEASIIPSPAAGDLGSVGVIIPALNEQASVGRVVAALPTGVGQVIVVDNGSTDRTAAAAQQAGADVVREPRRGYGSACLAGLAALHERTAVVAFLDADFADDPALLPRLVQPILDDYADLVIGSRTRGGAQPGSLTLPQRIGNRVATSLLGLLWHARFTDLGPFRAVRRSALDRLAMDDTTYGWTVQMQIRAARQNLRCREIPVPYRPRIGVSKISGTVRGLLGATLKIPATILRERLCPPRHLPPTPPPRQLIAFARLPRPGEVKTRLIPAIGPDAAADLHHRMTVRTLQQADAVDARLLVRCTGPADLAPQQTTQQMHQRFGPRPYRDQGDGDLGQRLHRAAADAFAEGARQVVLIGTDCPQLTTARLRQAFAALNEADLVIGPAHDGGYYLLGLRRMMPELFTGIDWGSGDVLRQTLAAAGRGGASVALLEPLGDVDRPEDLPTWEAVARGPGVSVIVPTLNEQAVLERTLRQLLAGADAATQIIVADGGSDDATAAIARRLGVTLVHAPPGRARQMNAGAAAAHGSVLLFCHADTHLPTNYVQWVRQAITADEGDARRPIVGGAFTLHIAHRGRAYRAIERAVRLRSHRLHRPYGDQAIFVRRDVFDAMHGYDEALGVMEDYDFVRRLRTRGIIVPLDAPARTSARYWQRHGPLAATLRNQLVIAAYHLGLSPQSLAALRRPRA